MSTWPAALALSVAGSAGGLLVASTLLLLHQDGVWSALDGFLARLDDDSFQETLPLLRRAFSGFGASERRAMGEKVKHLGASTGRRRAASGRRDDGH